jgi:hypothetical protein
MRWQRHMLSADVRVRLAVGRPRSYLHYRDRAAHFTVRAGHVVQNVAVECLTTQAVRRREGHTVGAAQGRVDHWLPRTRHAIAQWLR